ncbi:MAG: hypothetical protein RL563_2341 [Pseudomonadota bacterium]|jgi:type VI secretion system protein ImpA
MVDLSGLLAEISTEDPCGENLEYDPARVALDTNILGIPENQFTGEKAQPPNWREIEKQALALLQRSRDIQVIMYLIRSQIPLQGWIGLQHGLEFLYESLLTYWDSIHPQLDPDDDLDPTIRVNLIEELNSYEFILRPLSLAFLVESKSIGRFCLRDLQYATDKIETPEDVSKPDINVIRGAFLDADAEILSTTRQAISDSLQLVEKMEDWVSEKVGASQAPSLSSLKSLLKEVIFDFQQYAGNEGVQEIEASDDLTDYQDASSTETTTSKVKSVTGSINNRQDVLKMLDLICKYYEEQEPSSPVPLLLHRAKYLVTADFMAIVQNLMPDGLSQLEIIKGPDPFSE